MNNGNNSKKKEQELIYENNPNIQAFIPLDEYPELLAFEKNYKIILEEYYEVMREEKLKIFMKSKDKIINDNLGNNLNAFKDDLKINSENDGINNITEEESIFEPWVEKNLYEQSNENGWDVAPLMIGGNIIEKRCKKFPKLYEIAKSIDTLMSISFSLLKPGTHIVPHKGYDEYSEKILRYHLGLIVPDGDLALRVDSQTIKWEVGKSFIFDDFLTHEAWNFTSQNRLVLIVDFLRKNKHIYNNKLKINDENEFKSFKDKRFNESVKNYFQN